MKTIYKLLLFVIFCVLLSLASCSDWTDPGLKNIDTVGGNNTQAAVEAYYADLREWKNAAHNYKRPVSFGWFSNWSPSGAVRKGYMSSVPDSLDMISLWSGPFNLSEDKIKDKEYVQKVKGTKVFVCYILHNIGTGITPVSVFDDVRNANPDLSEGELNEKLKKAEEVYWGFTSGVKGTPDHTEAIKRYAKVLCDSIIKYDYDGLDIDWEPNVAGDGYGNLKDRTWTSPKGEYLHILIEALSEYLGPKATVDSGKYRYLLVDGELTAVSPSSGPYIDYLISQAYNSSNLESRTTSTRAHFGESYNTRKHIFTENFESYSQGGGFILNHATYNSPIGPKGGVGAFRFDNDYDNQPDYKFLRQSIQLMHQSYADYMANQNESNE